MPCSLPLAKYIVRSHFPIDLGGHRQLVDPQKTPIIALVAHKIIMEILERTAAVVQLPLFAY